MVCNRLTYYRRLLDRVSLADTDRARSFEALEDLAIDKDEPQASLEWYSQSLKIRTQILDEQYPATTSNYNSIGEAYQKQGDHGKALEYYNNALKALGEVSVSRDLTKQAVHYNSIGVVHQEQNHYKVLEFYKKGFQIRKDHLRNDETSIGMS